MYRSAIIAGCLVLAVCACDDPEPKPTLPFETETPPTRALRFDAACDEGDRVTILAVGDMLLNSGLQQQALDRGEGHASLWDPVRDLIETADIAYMNFEGTASCCTDPHLIESDDPGYHYDNVVYTAHPTFNYHQDVAGDLVDSGFDVVSTANNHAMDRGIYGADETVRALRAAGMPLTGSRLQGETDDEAPWYSITEAKGFRIAWVACTNRLNYNLDRTDWRTDDAGQVLECQDEGETLVAVIRELSERSDIDAVIAVPHCGGQWDPEPTGRLRSLVPRMIEAGALAVLATSSHDLSYWEKREHPSGREAFVAYSLGNFVSGQRKLPRRSTMLLYLGLTRGPDGLTRINGVRYVPAVMAKNGTDYRLVAIDRADEEFPKERNHITSWYGSWNLSPPTTPVETSPQCNEGWAPAPTVGNAAGERCMVDSECIEGLVCDGDFPNKACSTPCEDSCPQRAGASTAMCVEVEGVGRRCLQSCNQYNDCRELYECAERPLGAGSGKAKVCYPEPEEEE